MAGIISSDVYRLGKSAVFRFSMVFSSLAALSLMLLNRNEIQLGISVFSSQTNFVTVQDVVRLGIQYQKFLGIILAVLISIFIGQEHQWSTWQQKLLLNPNRQTLYLAKASVMSALSIACFLIFELSALFSSGRGSTLLDQGYFRILAGGILIYAALGSVLCLIAMLVRHNALSVAATLGFVLFGELPPALIQGIPGCAGLGAWLLRHSVSGLSATIANTPAELLKFAPLTINALAITVFSSAFGIFCFRRFEF